MSSAQHLALSPDSPVSSHRWTAFLVASCSNNNQEKGYFSLQQVDPLASHLLSFPEEPCTFSCRSTFKRLFLHKNKDKKYTLEGTEETENTVLGPVVLEATTMKKTLEGWSPTASGMDSRATRAPEDRPQMGP